MSPHVPQPVAWRGFRIRAGMQGGAPRANIFRDGVPGLRHHLPAPTVDAALAAARGWIDDWHEAKQRGRTREGERVIGSKEDFEDALQIVSIGDRQLLMLKAHYRAPDRTLSAGGLARAAGYADYQAANSIYGRLGKSIADAADLPKPPSENRQGQVVWTGILAWDAGQTDERNHFLWRMYDPLADAIGALNMG